jgi:hypothetical protein
MCVFAEGVAIYLMYPEQVFSAIGFDFPLYFGIHSQEDLNTVKLASKG